MKAKTFLSVTLFLLTFHSVCSQKLFKAIEDQNIEKISKLIDKGENVNQQIENGLTPLFSAAATGNIKIVELLLSKGANVNTQLESKATALHIAA